MELLSQRRVKWGMLKKNASCNERNTVFSSPMTRTAPLSRAASCLVLPTSAMWSRLVSPRLALKCKRLEAPPPGLLMLHHAPLLHFLNEIESSPGLLLLFDSIQQPF